MSAKPPRPSGIVLTSLAILKVQDDRFRRDYIEFFVPFLVELLRELDHPADVLEIQAGIEERFGLRMPQGAVRTVAGRAVHKGDLTRDHDRYSISSTVADDRAFRVLRDEALAQQRRAVGLLVSYAKTARRVDWTEEEAEAALLAFLSERSVPVLAGALVRGVIPEPDRSIPNSNFIVGSFLVDLWTKDRESFVCVETLLKGNLLADALFFPELGQVSHRLDRLQVYIDTPLVLRALGAHGSQIQMAIRELLEMLYALGASLRCFRQTFEETLGVLDATGKTMRSEGAIRTTYSSLLQTLLEAGKTPSDVELMAATLDKFLKDFRVEVVERPPHEARLTLDETALEGVLQDTIGYRREETMRHDLDSLTAIHRLRDGSPRQAFETSKAVFVTTNTLLVHASRVFFGRVYARPTMPLCLADYQLATLAWLKQPAGEPDLPRSFVIADCYAAMNPPEPVWRAYLDEIARLEVRGEISTDDYYLLRFSSSAKATLMDFTNGRPQAVNPATVREVLDRTQERIRSESEAVALGVLDMAAAAESRAASVSRERDQAETQRKVQYASLGAAAARWLGRVVTIGATAILAVAAAALTPRDLPNLGTDPSAYLPTASCVAILLYLLAVVANAPGTGIARALARRFELSVARSVSGWLAHHIERQGTRTSNQPEPHE